MICKIIFQSHISSFQENVKTNVYAIEVSEGIEHYGGDFSGDYSDRKSHKNTCRSQKCKRRTGLGVFQHGLWSIRDLPVRTLYLFAT